MTQQKLVLSVTNLRKGNHMYRSIVKKIRYRYWSHTVPVCIKIIVCLNELKENGDLEILELTLLFNPTSFDNILG